MSISTDTHATSTNMGSSKDSKHKKEGEHDFNIEEILHELQRDILRIYKTYLNPHADLQTRNPLDLLTVFI